MVRKSVLITGGMGFVGANIALKFMDEGYQAILYDIAQTKAELLRGREEQWQFVPGDARDWWTVLDAVRQFQVEGIIHTALLVSPAFRGLTRANLDACQNLLEICRLEKLKFVFTSSNAAYGYRPDPNPLLENDFAPVLTGAALDEYGAMKQMCDTLVAMYHAVHGVDAVSCRIAWVYGPGANSPWYPQWFLANALAGKPVTLEKGGDHKTDYTYVKDAARGVYLAFTVRPIKYGLYNVTSGQKVSAREAAETVKRIIPGASIEVGPGQMEKGLGNPLRHPIQVGAMLITRAEKDLGYVPTSLEQGLREIMEWYRKQPNLAVTPEPP